MDALQYLKQNITEGMPLAEIVDAFEKMCDLPMEDDLVFLETGTFNFTGAPRFYFSLVRQYPSEDGEFYQLRVNVLYPPDDLNRALSDDLWSDSRAISNIFDAIRQSPSFEYASRNPYEHFEIYLDET